MAISSSRSCPHCGDNHKGKPFAIYEDGYHCFSCGNSKRAIRNFRIIGLDFAEDVVLPEYTLNPSLFSLQVLKWLRGYHVTDELIYKYHIAETDDHSVITPVLDKEIGKVVMYQRRWFDPRRIMTYGTKRPFIASAHSDCKVIAIVEDFISAIRVGETVDAYCMFGTSVSNEILSMLVKQYDIILIWADGDAPGQNAANKLHKTLDILLSKEIKQRAFAFPFNKIVHNVLTDLDPKCYINTEIRTMINNCGVFHDKNNKEYS